MKIEIEAEEFLGEAYRIQRQRQVGETCQQGVQFVLRCADGLDSSLTIWCPLDPVEREEMAAAFRRAANVAAPKLPNNDDRDRG